MIRKLIASAGHQPLFTLLFTALLLSGGVPDSRVHPLEAIAGGSDRPPQLDTPHRLLSPLCISHLPPLSPADPFPIPARSPPTDTPLSLHDALPISLFGNANAFSLGLGDAQANDINPWY